MTKMEDPDHGHQYTTVTDLRQLIDGCTTHKPPLFPAPPTLVGRGEGASVQSFPGSIVNANINVGGAQFCGDDDGGRWPRQETLTLLELRSRLHLKFKEAHQKGPLWDEVSRMMSEEHGYKRSGKKCKQKLENLYKYYKKTKEGKDGKHYRFFRQLQALSGDDQPIRRSREAKIKEFIDTRMRKLAEKQQLWAEKMVTILEHKEQERVRREEEWKKLEVAKIDRERKFWEKERAWIQTRDAALMEMLGRRYLSKVQHKWDHSSNTCFHNGHGRLGNIVCEKGFGSVDGSSYSSYGDIVGDSYSGFLMGDGDYHHSLCQSYGPKL